MAEAAPRRVAKKTAALWLLTAASGFAGLGYQIVWTQQSAVWLGHEAAAVLAVVTAFFGGLGLGALALGPAVNRSRWPQRGYAALEVGIAMWSLVLLVFMPRLGAALLDFTGALPSPLWHWTVAFVGTFFLLLPATAAMGATLPALERMAAALSDQRAAADRGSALAALYASNTLGAVLGVLAAAFWLVPAWGLARTAGLCAALNLLCALGVWALLAGPAPAPHPTPSRSHRPLHLGALWPLAATGLLGIGYEVLVVRVISQVTQNTVYTFALLLAVYLVGTALGAATFQRGLTRQLSGTSKGVFQHLMCTDGLLLLLAASCLLGTASLWAAEPILAQVQHWLGPGMASALAAEAAIATTAFLLPTIIMGALFSQLCLQARAAGIGLGRALGVNTLGATAAPLVFGVLALPALGAKWALLMVAGAYLVLALVLAPVVAPVLALTSTLRQAWKRPAVWATATAAAALALGVFAPPLVFIDVPEGGQVLSYREGAMAAVSVVQDRQGVARLRIDNRQQEGSSSSGLADARQALLPLLLHPAPQRALFLGLGTGMTARAATRDPALQVDAVELLPEVVEASALFVAAAGVILPAPAAPRLNLLVADARRYVRAAGPLYDVIVSDNFHPARSGSGSLYTVEHFAAVRNRLASGGLFCQWLPLHQLDIGSLQSVVQSFMQVYPQGAAMLATNSLQTPVLGLLSHGDGSRFDVAKLRARQAGAVGPQRLAELGLHDEWSLFGSLVAGPSALKAFAGTAAPNTDDHPVVAYSAPRITYAPDSLPAERLLRLLQQFSLEPADLFDLFDLSDLPAADAADWSARLKRYAAARALYIQAGQRVQPVADAAQMLRQLRGPLLNVLQTSPDFRPAYDPLLRMAVALAPTDTVAARALLEALVAVQPGWPEARQALQGLRGQQR